MIPTAEQLDEWFKAGTMKRLGMGSRRACYAIPDTVATFNPQSSTPKDVWYIGGITDENAREISVKLDFLTPGKTYDAVIYTDAKDASGIPGDSYNPQAYTITNKKVTSKTTLKLRMAPCGGFAVSIRSR